MGICAVVLLSLLNTHTPPPIHHRRSQVIGNKWENYLDFLKAEYTEGEALDALGLKR